MPALKSGGEPPLTTFEKNLDKEASKVYGNKSGTVWGTTAKLIEAQLGLSKNEAGAISVTEESTLNNRLVSPGLVRSAPNVIVVFSGIGIKRVEDRLDEFVPLTRHLTTVAIANQAAAGAPWRVRRIIDVTGVGIAQTVQPHFPAATVKQVPLKPITPVLKPPTPVNLAAANLPKFVADFSAYLTARGLVYDLQEAIDFLAVALASQFVLFAGPSGSGKSTAARALADFLSVRHRIIEVPRGLQRQEEFVGYYSQLRTLFADTTHLAALRALEDKTGATPPVCVLEESNLSPFEGYASAIMHGLSGWSSPRITIPLHREAGGAKLSDGTSIPGDLHVGPFPRFFGTVNVDWTAPAPANKVAGRAAVVLLDAPTVDEAIAAIAAVTAPPSAAQAGAGAGLMGDPAEAQKFAATSGRLGDIEKAIKAGAKLLEGFLGANVVAPRDMGRVSMYVSFYDLIAQAAGLAPADALAYGVENATLHFVLPGLSGEVFDKATRGYRRPGNSRSGGLLERRLTRLAATHDETTFGAPVDFWTALS